MGGSRVAGEGVQRLVGQVRFGPWERTELLGKGTYTNVSVEAKTIWVRETSQEERKSSVLCEWCKAWQSFYLKLRRCQRRRFECGKMTHEFSLERLCLSLWQEYSQGEMHGHDSWFWSLRKREIRTKDTNIRATDTEVIAEMIMGSTEYGAWSYRR